MSLKIPVFCQLKPLYLTMICLLLSACSTRASARSLARHNLSVEVVDASGSTLPTYHHRGTTYVQGEYGERYQIKLHNHSQSRKEVVVTVDGRDVINGQIGSYRHRGYVLDPYSTVYIQGFRKSDTEVATFRFTSPSQSYSGRMGTQQHVGIIGVALFEESHSTAPPRRKMRAAGSRPMIEEAEPTIPSGSNAMLGYFEDSPSEVSAAPSSRKHHATPSRQQAQSEIGTQYGEDRYSEVEEVSFQRRSSSPQLVFDLRYDSEQGLRRRGIIPPHTVHPSAFPDEPRYAPPPP